MNYKQHPLSSAFPAMQADEYQALCDSIGNIGVQNPVTLFEGMVLDGWHRYTGARAQFIECPTVELGDIDPRDFVIAQNNSRRNLTASQRAMAVTSVYDWHAVGKPSNCAPVHNNNKTGKELAALAGVSIRTINDTKTAQKAGFAEAVKAGAITVKEAATIASGTVATPRPAPQVEPVYVNEEDPIYILSEENDRLNDRLATVAMDATPEERAAAVETIETLRALVKTLTAELDAVKASRDGYMQTNKELMSQCASQRRQIEKLSK